ncbi:MAG: hypothetical protein A3J93_00600 [Candidatus Magasanikbacteria bacterium RIFOXYC2_FULL_42_28]|uniref:DUF7507 domain-containing protein n=1 Tax=Candidatus Magasanikbacteria bacterium RIFOXYC2_FULL_42_28 TaxID=1798704 RepID=A0A1F6NXC6_9BACT|nr:MAG: hypothetical protein A3J93_00600 [Candidatus Magasanikbacteria bacterium RIFOXYC2_FULL_42_28]
MKKFSRNTLIFLSIVVLAFFLAGLVRAAITVNLLTADSFAVLAGAGITNTGATTIAGDIGTFPTVSITGTSIITFTTGTNHDGDATTQGAKTDLATAYTAASAPSQACNTNLTGQDLGGMTLTPGVYCFDTSAQLTGTLTLNGQGNPNAVFIFQIGSTLTTASNAIVSLINSSEECRVFWQVGSSATLGTNTNFKGNILALTSITLTTGASVGGRVLAQNGAVTLDANTITRAVCSGASATTLTVVKTVTNNNGGTKTVSNFPLFIDAVAVSSSVTTTASVGLHTVSETTDPGYLSTIGGDCSANGTTTLLLGDAKICTITNDDIAPQLIVTKTVVNDNSGSKVIADFSFFIDGSQVSSTVASTTSVGLHTVSETADSGYTSTIGGDCAADGTITLAIGDVKTCTITNNDVVPPSSGGGGGGSSAPYIPPVPPLIDVVKIPSPLALPAWAGTVTYTYTVRNIGTVPMNNITMVEDSCSPVKYISGDTNLDSKLDVIETWTYTCATTLTKTHTNIVVATGWANGISTTDIATAIVVVGAPVVPPLIHITKVPSPLALLAGGGLVTYTKVVTNPGTVPLSNVVVSDDKCSPINYISGDTNTDSKLDVSESWVYTCSSNLTKTTVNTAVATGVVNGLTARDFAIATVVVADVGVVVVPKFPETGIAPNYYFGLSLLVGIFTLISVLSVVAIKRSRI